MTTPDNDALLTSWIDAWNAADGARLAALYTSDGSYTDTPSGINATGTDAIAGFVTLLATSLVSDLRWRLRGQAVTDTRAYIEWTWSATNQQLVPGDSAIGRPYSVDGVTTLELTDGKISRSQDYYDYATILRAVGALTDQAPA